MAESLFQARLTVDEYGTVWLGEPGEGEAVGDLLDRDEETLQVVWREDRAEPPDGSRVDFNEARELIEKWLKTLLDSSHAEHFGPFCPVCGLVTSTQIHVKEWKP